MRFDIDICTLPCESPVDVAVIIANPGTVVEYNSIVAMPPDGVLVNGDSRLPGPLMINVTVFVAPVIRNPSLS